MSEYSWLWISPIVLALVFVLGWWRQLHTRNAGWVDVIWAICVPLLAVAYCITGQGDDSFRIFIALIYCIWFVRLAWHLVRRVGSDSEEDGRYRQMRQWAGNNAPLVFFLFYLMQASWVWLFSAPAWILAQGQWPPLWATGLALIILALALAGETTADKQLAKFKSQPHNRGTTCRQGFWRYSRHPNYFFEWCHWFAYPLLGLASPSGTWLWLWPPMMLVFLLYVTGIPYTEQQALRSRGEDYRRYQASTSRFIPWFPKSPEGEAA